MPAWRNDQASVAEVSEQGVVEPTIQNEKPLFAETGLLLGGEIVPYYP
jgi:hypothetical protein